MADFANAALTEFEAARPPAPPNDSNPSSVQEEDNKFQKAISAWRSMLLSLQLPVLADRSQISI